jgi:hypothetical protein
VHKLREGCIRIWRQIKLVPYFYPVLHKPLYEIVRSRSRRHGVFPRYDLRLPYPWDAGQPISWASDLPDAAAQIKNRVD